MGSGQLVLYSYVSVATSCHQCKKCGASKAGHRALGARHGLENCPMAPTPTTCCLHSHSEEVFLSHSFTHLQAPPPSISSAGALPVHRTLFPIALPQFPPACSVHKETETCGKLEPGLAAPNPRKGPRIMAWSGHCLLIYFCDLFFFSPFFP